MTRALAIAVVVVVVGGAQAFADEPAPLGAEALWMSLDVPAAHKLTDTDARADVELLRRALRTAWGGNACGFATLREQVDRALEAATLATTPMRMCKNVAKILDALPDAHIEATLNGAACGRAAPAANVGKNFGAGALWKSAERKVGALRIGLVSIGHFLPPNDRGWTGFVDAVNKLLSTDALVIDLRGNGGGDDRIAYRLARLLAGRVVAREGAIKIMTRTPDSIVVRLNVLRSKRSSGPGGAVFAPDEALLRRELLEAIAGKLPSPITTPISPPSDDTAVGPGYSGRIFVLVDRRCGSSCENAVDLLRRLPKTRLVGEHTAGAIHFGNAGKLRLSHSGIEVQLGTQCTQFADKGFYEKQGFAPDDEVAPGHDALQSVLRHLPH